MYVIIEDPVITIQSCTFLFHVSVGLRQSNPNSFSSLAAMSITGCAKGLGVILSVLLTAGGWGGHITLLMATTS